MKFQGKKVAVIGLGVEGQDSLQFLLQNGALVTVFDQKEKEQLAPIKSGFELVTGPDYLKGGLIGFDYVVRSPGVRPDLPEIAEAVKSGAKLTSAINIFFELCPARIIGVTGTKGKGTTATLIHECLKASGKNTYLAGNIGTPYLELLSHLTRSDLVVLEMSSFQLIDIERSPHIAVVLNITTDHLDWHKNREEYVQAKENIVRFQTEKDFVVLMKDYETPCSFAPKTKAEVFWASIKEEVKGGYIKKGKIVLNVEKAVEIGSVDKLLLLGTHNWENIVLATCAAKLAGATVEGIKQAVFTFAGLPHRLELAGEYQGIKFYNDSFATSPTPTLAAVNSFSKPLILILGGSSKGLDYTEMARKLAAKKNVKAIIYMGEVGGQIKQDLENAGFKGQLIGGGKNMAEIIKNAAQIAESGDIVLLSPSAASFDMFKDYKDRGEQFKKAVRQLGS
ncbi:UDP-N-acetylmuramoyl-L-alanine--D-glutamate ligase [Candidatus Microgenomates bacterium]|nr:UDP-N-acetylmuramoyl-L-alanine--D-glutamate ligase [Candidatus Microgenomates bacterium]